MEEDTNIDMKSTTCSELDLRCQNQDESYFHIFYPPWRGSTQGNHDVVANRLVRVLKLINNQESEEGGIRI